MVLFNPSHSMTLRFYEAVKATDFLVSSFLIQVEKTS